MLSKAYIEITNCCNLHCEFCPGTIRKPKYMSVEEFRYIAQQVRNQTKFIYLHIMGEPLLHPELEDILRISLENELHVIITTNGTLLPSRTELLLHSPALHKINISLHSIEANGFLSSDSYLISCAQFVKDASAKGIICCLRLWNLDGETPGLKSLNTSIIMKLHELFPDVWKENTKGYQLQPRVFLEWGERFEWPNLDDKDRGIHGFCYALRDQFGILCDGTVVPCCLDHDGVLALGNIFQTNLEDIITSDKAKEIYNGFSRRIRNCELCRHCGYSERFSK